MYLSAELNDMLYRNRHLDSSTINQYDWQVLCYLGTQYQEQAMNFYINIHLVEIRVLQQQKHENKKCT